MQPVRQLTINEWKRLNPTAYFQQLQKHNLTRLAKEEARTSKSLKGMRKEEMKQIDTDTLKRMAITAMGLSEAEARNMLKQRTSNASNDSAESN